MKMISQKIAIITILLISFFGMNLEEGKGQCQNFECYDNNNIPWIYETLTHIPYPSVDPNCWIRITYKYRIDLGPNRLCPNVDPVEIVVIEMLVSGSCYYDHPPHPKIYNINDNFGVYKDAFMFLVEILHNRHQPNIKLLPTPGIPLECVTLVNQKKQSCSKEILTQQGHREITWCNSQSCCNFSLKNCNKYNGTRDEATFEFASTNPPPLNKCFPVIDTECKWSCFNNPNDILLPKNSGETFEFIENEVHYRVSSDNIEFNFKSENQYDVNVQIVNLLGVIQFEGKVKYVNSQFSENINISKYNNGSYYLILTNGNVVIDNFKFIVNK